MKKFKYLTPILGLATVATAILPLASCNDGKDDKNITKDEWHTALDKIWKANEARDFSSTIKLTMEDLEGTSVEERKIFDVDYKVKGLTNKVKITLTEKTGEEEPEVVADKYAYSKYETDWQIEIDEDDNYSAKSMSDNLFTQLKSDVSNWTHYWMFAGVLYDWYDSSTYSKDTNQYKFTLVDYDSLKLSFALTFNSESKLLEKADADFYFKAASSGAMHCNAVLNFFDYGKTAIDGLDTNKADTAIKNLFKSYTMDSATIEIPSFAWKDHELTRIIFYPPDASNETYTYNRFYLSKGTDWVQIFLDDKLLVEDEDYTLIHSYNDPETIKFIKPIDNTKTIFFKINPWNDESEVTAKLYYEA